MAQVTIYLSDEILSEARRRAKRQKKSLSAYLSEILARETAQNQWPQSFVDLLNQGGGDLTEPEDPPPEEVDL
jgi:hypothetical protein